MAQEGINTTTDIDNALVAMLAESRFIIEHKPAMKQLTRNVSMPAHGGGDYRIPKYATVAASALSQGVDIGNAQKLSDSLTTITPTEIGLQVVLVDRLMRTVRDDMVSIAGRLMADALVRKLATDGLGMFTSFSTGLGSAGTALTFAYIHAAKTAIESNSAEPAPAPYYGIFHSNALHPFVKNISPTGTYPIPSGISEELIRDGFVMKTIGGVEVFKDNQITIDSSDDSIGAVMSKEALILVNDEMPSIEKERDASLRAWELNQSWWYAYGEYVDLWARKMTFDSIIPTS